MAEHQRGPLRSQAMTDQFSEAEKSECPSCMPWLARSRGCGDTAVLCHREGGGRWRPSAHPSSGAIRHVCKLLSSAALAKFTCTGSKGFLSAQGKKSTFTSVLVQSVPRCVCRGDLGRVCSLPLAGREKSPFVRGAPAAPLAERRGDARSSASISRELSLSVPGLSGCLDVGCLQKTPLRCDA